MLFIKHYFYKFTKIILILMFLFGHIFLITEYIFHSLTHLTDTDIAFALISTQLSVAHPLVSTFK